MAKIAQFEKNKNWQATAEDANKHQIAIMRGQPGGQFEGNFYLYDGNWTAIAYPPPLGGMHDHSVKDVQEMFASGALNF
jgi:hypothetical protein